MDKAKPKFSNELFSKNFTKTISEFKYSNILNGTQVFNQLLQNIILDYKFNRDAASTNVLLKKFDATLKEFLGHFNDQPLSEKEKKALTEMLQEFKKNPTIATIRTESVTLRPQPTTNQNEADKTVPKKEENTEQAPKEEVKNAEEEKVAEAAQSDDKAEKKNKEEQVKSQYTKRDPNELLALLKQLREQFDDHRIDDAHDTKEKIQQWVNEVSPDDEENKRLVASAFEENKTLLRETDFWYKEIHNILNEMDADEGYTEDTGHKTYTLKYKPLPDGKAIIKLEGPLKIPLFNALALMYEAEGFSKWVPFCSDAKLIKRLHKCAHVYYLRYGLPPPLTSRECHCFGYGADRFDRNGSVLLISRSIDNNQQFLDEYGITIPKETKYVRMDIDVATEFTPINKEEMIMRQVITVDVKVKNTPPFILSWISRKTAQHMFETMIKRAKNLKGTMWEKGINNNRDFYGWLGEKVDRFLTGHELA